MVYSTVRIELNGYRTMVPTIGSECLRLDWHRALHHSICYFFRSQSGTFQHQQITIGGRSSTRQPRCRRTACTAQGFKPRLGHSALRQCHAINVLLTLLSNSVLAGIGAFAFSTIVVTLFGEIIPQAYFSRNALRMAARLTPLLNVYRVGLFPIAKPTAIILNWWLGPEGITFLRERDFRALITRHAGVAGADVGQLEAIGALNFLDLDDILVVDEGESVDPRSIITLPIDNGRPVLPKFERSPDDPFLRCLNASGKKMGHHHRCVESTVVRLGCTPFSARFSLQYNVG